jgi:hypothetical protein
VAFFGSTVSVIGTGLLMLFSFESEMLPCRFEQRIVSNNGKLKSEFERNNKNYSSFLKKCVLFKFLSFIATKYLDPRKRKPW